MNKKHFFKRGITFLFLILSFFTKAQKFNTSLSATYVNAPYGKLYKSGNDLITFEETDNKKQFAYTAKLSKVKFGVRLKKYDASMKLVKENLLFNGERICGPFGSSIQKLNENLFFVYTVYEEGSSNTIKIMGAKIDPVTLNIEKPKELLQIDQENVGLIKSLDLMERQFLLITQTSDNTKLLVLWSANMINQIFMSVLNSDLDKIWSKRESITSLNRVIVNSGCVDNNGNVYVAYRYTEKNNNYIGRVSAYSQQGKSKNIDFRIQGGKVHQASVVTGKKGDRVFAAGTYRGESDNLTGVFSQAISTSDFKTDKLQTKEFTTELVKQLDKDSWGSTKSKNYGIWPLAMQAYELEDGNISITGQFEKYISGGRTNSVVSGPILNVNLKSDNTVFSWIPRYRVSTGYLIGNSFFTFPYKNKLLIFYNDEADNLTKEIGEKYSSSNNYKNVVLAVASMDADGKLKREKLIDLANENYLPVGEAIIPLSSSSLWVPVLKIKGLGGIDAESKWGTISIE